MSMLPLFDGIESLSKKKKFNEYLFYLFSHKSTYQAEEEGGTPVRIPVFREKKMWWGGGGEISDLKSACDDCENS